MKSGIPKGSLALRPRKAADALDISQRHLWQLTQDGVIPCVRVGSGKRKTVLYPVDVLQRWLAENLKSGGGGTKTPVEKVLEKLPCQQKRLRTVCPAHGGTNLDLEIIEHLDSRVELTCDGGCSVNQICQAYGLTVPDLLPTACQLLEQREDQR